MGSSASQPSAEEQADAALFDERELAALRSCFGAIATPDGLLLEVEGFAAFPAGLPWQGLHAAMVRPGDEAARWAGFMSVIARCCKAARRERMVALAAMYADTAGEQALSGEGLSRLLADAFAASRLGDAPTADTAVPLGNVVADVSLYGTPITGASWWSWCSSQLPALALAQPTFLLLFLSALGRHAAGGGGTPRALVAAAGTAAAVAAARADHTVASALQAVQEPLLPAGASNGDSVPLLESATAWLLGLAIGPAVESREWRCLYSSASHGLSMNRFVHHGANYGGVRARQDPSP